MVTILSYSIRDDIQLELASLANELINKYGGSSLSAIIGYNLKDRAKELSKYFDEVVIADSEYLKVFDVNTYAKVLAEIAQSVRADVILTSSNRRDGAIASALSAILNVGSVSEVTKVELQQDLKDLILYRSAYGGLGQAKVRVLTSPIIISLKPGSYPRLNPIKQGTIKEVKVQVNKVNVELLEFKPKQISVKLDEADIVVVAGRGVKNKDDLKMLDELAKVLGGVVGCSRPLSADLGWFPVWVGMSGVTIKPKLYIGVGVSGQIQHVAGIRDSKIIVAINIDPNAPIFEYADYGIVGDLYKVLPRLTEKLREVLKK